MSIRMAILVALLAQAGLLFTPVLASADLPAQAGIRDRHWVRHTTPPPQQTAPKQKPAPALPAQAGPTSAQSPAVVPLGRRQEGLCMNFGYEPIHGSYDLAQDTVWLKQLSVAGITCVRLGFYGQNASVTKPLALLAKNLGFYVQIGNDGDPRGSGYSSGVISFAQWAQSNGIDQISIGNEADNGGANQATLAALSCQVRAVYSGVISYDTYKGLYDPITSWAGNMACLDKLGLNIYADYANTTAEAQQYLAGHWYISETNLDCDAGLCADDSTWASGLSRILGIERAYPVKINVFAFTAGGDGVASHWGVLGHPAVMHTLGL